MKNLINVFLVMFCVASISPTFAHGGRTDTSGGHKCSEKSQQKGLCTGYHYHG